MSTYAKEVLDKLKSNKSKDGNKLLLEETRGSLVGAGIGLFLGLYFAHTKNMNMFVSGAVGAIVGGLLTKTLINKF